MHTVNDNSRDTTIYKASIINYRLTALFLGLPGWAGTRKVKPIWILLKQETVSGSGISWAVCKSAPRSRQITTPAPHHSFFYRPDALPATQPTASKHWRQVCCWQFTARNFFSYTVTVFQLLLQLQSPDTINRWPFISYYWSSPLPARRHHVGGAGFLAAQ